MALQVGPNLLSPSLLTNPSDSKANLREALENQGTPDSSIGPDRNPLPSFGREFELLLNPPATPQAAAASEAEVPAFGLKPKNLSNEKAVELASIQSAAQFLMSAQTPIAQNPTLAEQQVSLNETQGNPLMAQRPGASELPKPENGSQNVRANQQKALSQSDQRWAPSSELIQTQLPNLVEIQTTPRFVRPEKVSELSSKKPLEDAGQLPSELNAGLLGQLGVSEIEADGSMPRQSEPSKSRSSMPTMDHLSGKDFLKTWDTGRAQPLSGARESVKQMGSLTDSKVALLTPAVSMLRREEKPLEKDPFGSDKISGNSQLLSSAVLAPRIQASDTLTAPPQTLTAQVTTGSQAQNRLSNESLAGLTSALQQFTVRGQDQGQIRIRLKPDTMGEIQLKVRTIGNQVDIQVHASDEGAKKILESSLSDLKEQLASKNLSLASVDVGMIQKGFSMDSSTQDQSSGWNQANHSNQWNQSNQSSQFGGNSRESQRELNGWEDRGARVLPRAMAMARPQQQVASGRLDVMA